MKAYIARDANGVIIRGWLLAEPVSAHCHSRRLSKELASASVSEVTAEAALRGAAERTEDSGAARNGVRPAARQRGVA